MYEPKKLIRQPQQRPSNRRPLEQELRRLQDEMLLLGSLVSRSILDAVDVLRQQDTDTAYHLILADQDVNQRRFAIEQAGLRLIATQNPIASDLRTITAVLEIVAELERINDYAKGIAKITLTIGKEPVLLPPPALSHMAAKAQSMLRRALVAFTERDVRLAYAIALQDEEIDDLYALIFQDAMQTVVRNALAVEHAHYLLSAAHNLERTGDRATNICERVVFTVTGKRIELDELQTLPHAS